MTQKLNEQLRESLSALVDGEASELEMRRILKNAEDDSEVRAKWQRYQIASSLMRKDTELDLSANLSDRIRAAIDGEENLSSSPSESVETVSTKVANSSMQWRDVLAKSSIAASVAAVLVLGTQLSTPPVQEVELAGVVDQQAAPAAIQNGSVNTAPKGFDVPSLTLQNASSEKVRTNTVMPAQPPMPVMSTYAPSPELQAELNYLMQQHAEMSSSQGGLGMLPFARVSPLPQTAEKAK